TLDINEPVVLDQRAASGIEDRRSFRVAIVIETALAGTQDEIPVPGLGDLATIHFEDPLATLAADHEVKIDIDFAGIHHIAGGSAVTLADPKFTSGGGYHTTILDHCPSCVVTNADQPIGRETST